MLSAKIAAQIKHIEIVTRKLLNGTMGGDSRSALKGSGFEFDQIRDYQIGDDVRFIDWAASLRTDKMLVKEYQEERNRTILLVVDGSASTLYGSKDEARHEIIAQIGSALALVGHWGKDSVGLLVFSDTIDLFVPPSQGTHHIHMVMERLFSLSPRHKKTDIAVALKKILALQKKGMNIFFLSDFIEQNDDGMKKMLPLIARQHDLVIIRILDIKEHEFPSLGFLSLQDPETGFMCTVSTKDINRLVHERLTEQTNFFRKNAIDCIDVMLDQDFLGKIIRFFRRRMMY